MAATLAQHSVGSEGLPYSREMSTPGVQDRTLSSQADKEQIAHFGDAQRALTPHEVDQTPESKHLGESSKTLSVNDFDLVRTLGTGLFNGHSLQEAPMANDTRPGTFARVSLARLKNPRDEDKDKVFALKVLRKAEGSVPRCLQLN